MKTLLITENFPPKIGGSGRWFWEIYSRLPREHYIIAAGDDERAEAFDATHDLRCVRWPLSIRNWGLLTPESIAGYIRLYKLLRRLVRKEQVGAIHCGRCLPEGLLGWLAWKWAGIAYVCYVHGEEVNIYSKSKELFWLSRKIFSSARQIIVNSKNTQGLLSCYDSIPCNRIRVLHPGVDTTYFTAQNNDSDIRKKLGWEGRKVMLTVGRLQKRKGHDYTIVSLNRIKEKIPEVLYAIIGDGEERAYLQEVMKRENLDQHVQFLGKMDDETLRNCYQQCDLFVLANREVDGDIEGFGMVLVEAQACGKPVIAGNSGGTGETMLPGETGLLVDCRNPKLIADAIIQLLEDPERGRTMGHRAAQWVRETFDWQSLVLKAENIFREI